MSSVLRAFEIELCTYLLDNVLDAAEHACVKANLKADLDDDHPVLKYLTASEVVEPEGQSNSEAVLLSTKDLIDLGTATHELSATYKWHFHPAVHRRRRRCVGEVRRKMTEAEARTLSRRATFFTSVLEKPGLSLATGVETIIDWIIEIRQWMADIEIGDSDSSTVPRADCPTVTGSIVECSDEPIAPRGSPGRKTNPELQKHAKLANQLRGQTPQMAWKEVATQVNEAFKLSETSERKPYTFNSIRLLHKDIFRKKKRG